MHQLKAAFLVWFFLPLTAFAAQIDGITFPDSVEVEGRSLLLNGLAIRKKTIFKAKVYAAGLYLTARTSNEKEILRSTEPKQLIIVFMRDVVARDIATSWDEGFAMNCTDGCGVFTERLEELKKAMVDMKNNESVTFSFAKDGFTLVSGTRPVRRFPGKDFSDLVLANFIVHAPTTEVKDGLLSTRSVNLGVKTGNNDRPMTGTAN